MLEIICWLVCQRKPARSKLKITVASALALLIPSYSFAQALSWNLVAAEPTRIPAPELANLAFASWGRKLRTVTG
jgi:hypothetical protein